MEKERQLVNLELSKKLKELGVKQESLYYHVDFEGYEPEIIRAEERQPRGSFDKRPNGVSAYTVAELGEMLPPDITQPETFEQCFFFRNEKTGCGKFLKWYVFYHDSTLPPQVEDTEANARAKMLAYLIENNLTSPQ